MKNNNKTKPITTYYTLPSAKLVVDCFTCTVFKVFSEGVTTGMN